MEKLSSQQSRWWDWAAVGLHLTLLETVAARLAATDWTPFLSIVQTSTYIGFTIGAVLGYSRFPRGAVRWLAFFYMLVMLPLQWTLVIDQSTTLEESLTSVAGRLLASMSDFAARQPVNDPFFFVAVMSIAFWIISSWAGFSLIRNQSYLGAVLPAAIGLLIIQGYDATRPNRLWFLAVFTLLALLLLGRLQFLQNRSSWRQRHIFVSPDNSFDLTSSMAVAAGLIIFVVWTIPASVSGWNSAIKTWDRVTRPWHDFTERMENAVSALQSPNRGKPTEFYGTNLGLGLGFPNSQDVMFTVRTPNLPPEQQPPRYYWRGRAYDHFADGKWETTGATREDFAPSPEQRSSQGGLAEQEVTRFSFQIGESKMSLLYGPSQVLWVSRAGTRFTAPAEGQSREVVSWIASPTLFPGETYQAEAVVKNPNTQQLREAGTDYPEWVTRKYTQLPADFSPRIAELAKEVTATADTPYDKATAITNYLRQTIQYVPTIQRPPRDRDPLEWVLFEYKKAYCVYYATSEVLMLRSLGVPARMAVGFTQGNPFTVDVGPGQQPRVIEGTYVVLRNNAHAWPEVYFPEIGWVEFEPTAGQSPLDRPLPLQEGTETNGPVTPLRTEDDQEVTNTEPEKVGMDAPTPPETRFLPLYFIFPFLIVCALAAFLFSRRTTLATRLPVFLRLAYERNGIDVPIWIVRWESWVTLSPIEKAFESVNFGLRQLDRPLPVYATPIERAAKLTSLLPEEADQIKVLLDEHQTSLYTSRIASVTQARRAAFDIRKQVIRERIRRIFFGKPLS